MKLKDLLILMEKVQKKSKISKPFICGGTPRDKILGRLDKIEDLDITTGDATVQILAKETSMALQKNFSLTTKQMNDGHSSIYLGDFKIDFSSNFNAPDIDVILGKMGIKNPTSLQREIFSRDFTCNALLMTLDLKAVIDPTHRGFKDIEEKMIRTCLSPEITLTTNKNRVVRAIYLAAKLGFEIDPKIVEWVRRNPDSIKISTTKSLAEKLNKAIAANPTITTYYLDQMGLWKHIPITKELYPYYIKRLAAE